MPSLDILVPVYNEADSLDIFLEKTLGVVDELRDWQVRLVIIDDGSKDTSPSIAKAWMAKDSRLELIELSRNFGHEAALNAGLEAASADAVIVMDADLQDPPELIIALTTEFLKGFDVVNAHRALRPKDNVIKRLSAFGFYRLVNTLAGSWKIPANVGNYRLLSRRVVSLLNQLPEKNRVFRVLVPYLGFPTATVEYQRPPRVAGKSHYNYRSMTRLAINGISSSSTAPLQIAVRLGLLISTLGFAYIVWVIIQALILKTTVDGWASLMSAVIFLGGVQLIFLGVLGEYVGRIFWEVKHRPDHIVKTHHRSEAHLKAHEQE